MSGRAPWLERPLSGYSCQMATRRVLIALVEGFADSGVGVLLDVLATANQIAARDPARRFRTPPFEVLIGSLRGRAVRSGAGYRHAVDGKLDELQADVLVIPGLFWATVEDVEAGLRSKEVRALADTARVAHASGTLVCAGCSGAFVAAEAGILDGQPATTSWWLAADFQRRYPLVDLAPERVLTAGKGVLSCGTGMAVTDLALHLVHRFASPALARLCARFLLVDERVSQAPYVLLRSMAGQSPTVEKVERWVRAHLAEEIDLPRLARAVGASARTLARRIEEGSGITPGKLVQRVRVEAATALLESTELPLEEIALRVGYRDVSALRKLVVRDAGRGPREIRRRTRQLKSVGRVTAR